MSNAEPRWRACARAPTLVALAAVACAPGALAAAPAWQVELTWPDGSQAPAASVAIGPDGAVTAALRAPESPATPVTRIDGSGTVRWSVGVAAQTDDLHACGGRICLGGASQAGQLDAGNGALLWLATRIGHNLGAEVLPGPEGGVLRIERSGIPAGGFPPSVLHEEVVAYDANGAVRYTRRFGMGTGAVVDWVVARGADGQPVIWGGQTGGLWRLAADGALDPLAPTVPPPYRPSPYRIAGRVGDDGAIRLLVHTGMEPPPSTDLRVALLQAAPLQDVALTPLTVLPLPRGSASVPAFTQVLAGPARSSVVGIERRRDQDPWAGSFQLVQVAADGTVAWRRDWTTGVESHFVAVAAAAGTGLLSRRRDGATVLRVVDAAGDIVRQDTLDCDGLPCPYALGVAAVDGADLVVVGSREQAGRPVLVASRWDGALLPAPAIAIAQAGLAGAWFAPYTAGQGLTLRLFPDGAGGATVFMPWFNYDLGSVDDGDAASLRWYALQGDVAAGATQATLAIVERRGGVFATAAAAAPVQVGQATLRFSGCAGALLAYRFDPDHNDGAEGSVALQPLLPRPAACTDADGQVQPAQADYDDAMSGHWFDPVREGQGIELARIAADASGDGLLYGAWFTFDPSPADDAPQDQHWFTLQGQAPLPGGGVRTTIVQTLGGRFDSVPAGAPFRVGEAELRPGPDCSALTLRYRFDDTDEAGAFRSRGGELQLRRLGACTTSP